MEFYHLRSGKKMVKFGHNKFLVHQQLDWMLWICRNSLIWDCNKDKQEKLEYVQFVVNFILNALVIKMFPPVENIYIHFTYIAFINFRWINSSSYSQLCWTWFTLVAGKGWDNNDDGCLSDPLSEQHRIWYAQGTSGNTLNQLSCKSSLFIEIVIFQRLSVTAINKFSIFYYNCSTWIFIKFLIFNF